MKFFIGVIEDRQDPEQLGRFRVRVLGLHTEDKVLLPTKDLPWSTVITPSGGNSGLGQTPPFFVNGTWVLLSFRDDDKQEPLIHGSISGKPAVAGTAEETGGFFDPEGKYPLEADVSDVNEMARGSLTAANPVARDVLRKTGVATADFDEITSEEFRLAVTGSPGSSWDMPVIVNNSNSVLGTYAPSYPLNKVFASETGHVLEFDDTTDFKRIQLSHASGSYLEYSNEGTCVSHIVKDKYDVVNSDLYVAVGGNEVHSTDGSLKVFANKGLTSGSHYDIEVGAGANINITVRSGDVNMRVQGNVNQLLDGDLNVSCDNFNVDASNKVTMSAGDVMQLNGTGVDINGDPIDLN
tara:strand:- start:168 stop:1223 length:1056 start_codon:yes stop_codon:yes gene_type:complete